MYIKYVFQFLFDDWVSYIDIYIFYMFYLQVLYNSWKIYFSLK